MTPRAPLAVTTRPSPWPKVAGTAVLLTAIISILLIAFAWQKTDRDAHCELVQVVPGERQPIRADLPSHG